MRQSEVLLGGGLGSGLSSAIANEPLPIISASQRRSPVLQGSFRFVKPIPYLLLKLSWLVTQSETELLECLQAVEHLEVRPSFCGNSNIVHLSSVKQPSARRFAPRRRAVHCGNNNASSTPRFASHRPSLLASLLAVSWGSYSSTRLEDSEQFTEGVVGTRDEMWRVIETLSSSSPPT